MLNLAKCPGRNIFMLVTALAEICTGVVCLCTLGFYTPDLDIRWVMWLHSRSAKIRERAEKDMEQSWREQEKQAKM